MIMEKIILNVEGMSCSHCENRVKKAVSALGGVASVTVDLAGKTVTIEYAGDKPDFKTAIEEHGYKVV